MTPDPKTNIAELKPHLFDLWKFFSDEHGLTLVESELNDIIHAVVEHAPQEIMRILAAHDASPSGCEELETVKNLLNEYHGGLPNDCAIEGVEQLIKYAKEGSEEVARLKGEMAAMQAKLLELTRKHNEGLQAWARD